MAALSIDLTAEQGSTFVLEFQVFDDLLTPIQMLSSSIDENGTLQYALDNYRLRMKIRRSKFTSPILYSAGTTANFVTQPGSVDGFTTDGFAHIGGATGFVRMIISSDTSSTFKGGRYFYDVELVELVGSDEIVSKLLDGKFEVAAEATK
jgi:hypothetical protein